MPTPTTYSVQSPVQMLDPNALVSELINTELGCWKGDIIRGVFREEEASVIENIPLSPCFPPDRLI
jgi:hypothetical protein